MSKEERSLQDSWAVDIFSMISSYLDINIYAIKKSGEYIFRNEALTKLVGDIQQGDTVDAAAWESCVQVMETGRPDVVEEKYKERWYLSVKSPLVENGEVKGVLGFSFDITKQKENEELKIANAALKERTNTLKLIAASIAHELRTPLRAIDINLSGIQRYLPALMKGYRLANEAGIELDEIEPGEYKLLEQAFKSARTETQAAFNVVDMLLVKTEQVQIDPAKFKTMPVMTCLNETLKRYHFDAGEREVLHVNGDNCFDFNGDELLLSHVFFNLIKNALYFIRVAGKGEITIWYERSEEYNKLYFKDTGTGIFERDLPHIFDMYYSKVKHGTGVGLAFCKMVMQGCGGDITCESKVGEYTTFILSFPVPVKE